jgi:hypothetical protein
MTAANLKRTRNETALLHVVLVRRRGDRSQLAQERYSLVLVKSAL